MDSWRDTDTIGKTTYLRPCSMAFSEQNFSFGQRLSQQLHCFSELSEALTLRILELDERIHTLEKSNAFSGIDTNESTKKLLAQSEQRVKYLQSLLDHDFNKEARIHALPDIQNEEKPLDEDIISDSILSNKDESLDEQPVEAKENFGGNSDKEGLADENHLVDTKYEDDSEMPLLSA